MKSGEQKHTNKTMKETIARLKDELRQLKTSAEDFENEIDSGTKKQQMNQESMDAMKEHIEKMEESVSAKILNLKDLKE